MFTLINTQAGKLIPAQIVGTLGFQVIVREHDTPKRIEMRIIIEKDLSPRIIYHVHNHDNLAVTGTSDLKEAMEKYNAIKPQPMVVGKMEDEYNVGNIL